MLKIIAIVVAVLIAALLAYAATRPDSFKVQRSALIKAPPEKVFALVSDLRAFNTWNPWARKEPELKGSYSGPSSGKGAAYAWEGKKVGSGRMEISEVVPPSRMTMKLEFIKPMQTNSVAEFTLVPQGDATGLTWAMSGPSPYISKLMGVFFNMDTMIGKDFEDGLANLKQLAEK